VRRDFPEPGMVSFHLKSMPYNENELPYNYLHIRANCIIVGYIFKPVIDEATGEEHCDVFLVNSVDINGQVPKLTVNNFSKEVLREVMAALEAAALGYEDWKAKKDEDADR
jgi:hypothetical protein